MKINEHQALLTPKVLLVPYSKHHVPTYHEWMQDEDLQKATASEPLTLPEEYAMQKSWRDDADKLTFIVCTTLPEIPHDQSEIQTIETEIQPGREDAPECMIGDVNLFLSAEDEDDEYENEPVGGEEKHQAVVGELEIMIASPSHRGKRLGRDILLAFLWYIVSSLPLILDEYHTRHGAGKAESRLKYFRVKIDSGNERSIKLFESVGFQRLSGTPNYFGELELRWGMEMAHEALSDIEKRVGWDGRPVAMKYGMGWVE